MNAATNHSPRLGNALAVLAFTMCVGLTGWTARGLVRVRTDVAVITENRFTSDDGLLVWQKLGELETAAARPEDPPTWLVNRLDRIENRLDDLIETVSRLPSGRTLDGPRDFP